MNIVSKLSLTILFGLTASKASAKGLTISGIEETPQKVLLSLQVGDQGFASKLYSIIHEINATDGLEGKTGPKSEISLLVWVSNQNQALIDPAHPEASTPELTPAQAISNLESALRSEVGLGAGQKIPHLEIISSEGPPNVAFAQDILEFGVRENADQPLSVIPLLDAGGRNTLPAVEKIAAHLGATIEPAVSASGPDDDGGNIEVTPEGVLYMGSTTTEELQNKMKDLTGQIPALLDTGWLFVGHVDEMLTFVPTNNACGSTLVYADPLLAITFMREFGKVPLIPREDVEQEGGNIRDPEKTKERFFSSLNYFLKNPRMPLRQLTLEDFDLAKTPRSFEENFEQMDLEFLGNLEAYRKIIAARNQLQKLRPAACQNDAGFVALPTLFYNRKGVTGDPAMRHEDIHEGYTAVAGYVNLLSLRQHVVIAEEIKVGRYANDDGEIALINKPSGFFGPIVRARLAKVLGGEKFVHEINTEYFEVGGAGSVHCATNTLRSKVKWR